jgi:hypothetical protein
MNELEEQLRQLVSEACNNPPGSLQRQKILTQIIRITNDKLWKENTPYYQDALQQTWLYFCRHVCGNYDCDRGTVVTWLNAYLRHRLHDGYLKQQDEQIRKVHVSLYQSLSSDKNDILDPVNHLAAAPDIPPILNEVKDWVEKDLDGDLTATHIQGYPHINCQLLILKRLPPETSWKELANEFGLTVSTLSSFYQRQCLPRLRKFAEKEGYL